MANVKVIGNVVMVQSSMKLEDIQMVAKYRPEALVLKDENDVPVFVVAVADTENESCGSINKYGVEFAGTTRSEGGNATVTMFCSTTEGDVKELIADSLGSSIANLNKIESVLPQIIEEIKAERAEVISAIEIIQ